MSYQHGYSNHRHNLAAVTIPGNAIFGSAAYGWMSLVSRDQTAFFRFSLCTTKKNGKKRSGHVRLGCHADNYVNNLL